jgi:hypothetical protein
MTAKKPVITGKTYRSDTGGTVKVAKSTVPPTPSKGTARKGKK